MRGQKVLLAAAVAWLLSVGFVFAGGQSESHASSTSTQAKTKVQALKFFHDNPEWQTKWTKLGELSGKEIGIKLAPTPYKTSLYKSKIKLDLTSASRSPGLFKWWNGYYAKQLVDAHLVANLSPLWNEVGSSYAPGIRKALTVDGVSYGFPLYVSYWVWFYSKKVFNEYHMQPPKTWDQMMKDLKFFKSKGIYGIGNTIGKSRWTSFIMFQEILYRMNPQLYTNLMRGKVHWTNPTVIRALKMWSDMLKAGYFAPMDSTMINDFPRMLKEGKLAFAPFGDWYGATLQNAGLVSGKDYGVFIPGPINPSAKGYVVVELGALMVGKKSSQAGLAKKWLKWYSTNKSAAAADWKTFRFAPTKNLSMSTIKAQDPARYHELQLIKSEYPHKLIRFWEATPTEIVNYAVSQFNAMMANPGSYRQVAKNIEKKAAEVWPTYHVNY